MFSRTSRTTQQLEAGDDIAMREPEPRGVDHEKTSAFRSLGWLDRFLAVWIFLAMLVGILLGNFVPAVGPALQKGEFVGVSIPIGNVGGSDSTDEDADVVIEPSAFW